MSAATHWSGGRLDDDAPRPTTPWQRLVSVLVLLWLFDFALGRRSVPADAAALDPSAAELRASLLEAEAAAAAGRRSILLIGDSVLAGDVLARELPEAWASQRVVAHMRRELGRDSDARVDQIALDALLPTDALRLIAELDRLDPAGEVEVVLELNLRYFSSHYAEQRECSRPAICELGEAQLDPRAPVLAWQGLATAATRARDWLREQTPVHRRRDRVARAQLDQLPGLAVARAPEPAAELGELDELDEAEARARVREHYRNARIHRRHTQLAALTRLLDRAAARGRKLTLFWTPLEDGFARRSLPEGKLGRRYAAIAGLVNDYDDPNIRLLDLDHPLFVDAMFLDHVHLDAEGSRLLALNLLHELNLPLAKRPFEAQMIHPEGHDRTLVHRVDVGYAEGGAWQALFRGPEGVAVSRDGARIVIADTHNHALRELRGTMQFVETLAGGPGERGRVDGPAAAAKLERPRSPELLGDAAWFIDGAGHDAIRVHERGYVRTPEFTGERCDSYRWLRARPGRDDRPPALWALCSDSRVLHIDLDRRAATQVSDVSLSKLVAFDLAPDALFAADVDGRLWRRELSYLDGRPRLGPWTNIFANTGEALLPHGHRVAYPYAYSELRLAKVVDLRFVERYGGLLVADEFPLGRKNRQLQKQWTERVQLRYFDLDAQRVLPWVKPVPHGEAHALYNKSAKQIASYWHLGAFALAQDDASLVWVERRRSRVVRVADGLLGVAKSGNHHTRRISIPLLQTLAGASRAVETQLRPDRFMSTRHEPLARRGPYVGVLFGSSLSSMSDRLSNYSLGRRLELELQRELGYRDLLRFDLFQVSYPASAFGHNVNNFDTWMQASVPPDVIFIEAHDFGGSASYLRETKTREALVAALVELRELADRYDTLVVFYDLSSLEANLRDGMRSTDGKTRALLAEAERLGFVVLDPGDRLLRELLRHSPWGNQPFVPNGHHGAPWAVDLTAQTLAAMVYPRLREFFRDRVPARERERPAEEFEQRAAGEPLAAALAAVELDPAQLVALDPAYVQTEFVDRELRVYVDLAGFGARDELDALAVAAIAAALREDVYAEFAAALRVELVEFGNYDEYGNGVLDSARTRWRREFDRASLEAFLRAQRPG